MSGTGGRGVRDKTDSLAAQWTPVPRSFHRDHRPESGVNLAREITEALQLPGLTVTEEARRAGKVIGMMRAAARGELRDSPDLDPVRRHPDLWELRWKFPRQKAYRMYFSEPGGEPDLVAHRFHLKDVSGTPDEIEAKQNDEMDCAQRRAEDGRAARWGHSTGCTQCIGD